jgi:hypothetical protein
MRQGVTAWHRIRRQLVAGSLGLICGSVLAQDPLLEAQFADLPRDPQALADAITGEVAAIRGLPFKQRITVSNQQQPEFERYLEAEMAHSLPPERAAAFGRVVRKVGLFNGPLIDDAVALMRLLATSQVAAYYNPDESAFYVLLEDAAMTLLAPIYAHELYHGLQDQYWDLDSYLLDASGNGLNDDEVLARQSVVEGEATYIMNLWMMEKVAGRPPPRFAVTLAVMAQALMTSSSLGDLISESVMPGAANEDLQASAAAMADIPPFMIETLLGAYLKGMAFVHTVAGQGWEAVGRLYADPPRSTEQILHPEKWGQRDNPVTIDFPNLASEPDLAGWTVLESNVIGEFQWRMIFNEFSLRALAVSAAAGWDGDRFAVLERNEDLLLLLYTTWDSEADADEFASAYRQLLPVKYAGVDEPTQVDVRGSDVLIVEGGDADQLPNFLDILARARLHD